MSGQAEIDVLLSCDPQARELYADLARALKNLAEYVKAKGYDTNT